MSCCMLPTSVFANATFSQILSLTIHPFFSFVKTYFLLNCQTICEFTFKTVFFDFLFIIFLLFLYFTSCVYFVSHANFKNICNILLCTSVICQRLLSDRDCIPPLMQICCSPSVKLRITHCLLLFAIEAGDLLDLVKLQPVKQPSG